MENIWNVWTPSEETLCSQTAEMTGASNVLNLGLFNVLQESCVNVCFLCSAFWTAVTDLWLLRWRRRSQPSSLSSGESATIKEPKSCCKIWTSRRMSSGFCFITNGLQMFKRCFVWTIRRPRHRGRREKWTESGTFWRFQPLILICFTDLKDVPYKNDTNSLFDGFWKTS